MSRQVETKFTQADIRILGDLSIKLGMLHWQNPDVGPWENQVAILLQQQERLNQMVANILERQL